MKNRLISIFLVSLILLTPSAKADLNVQGLAGTSLASAGSLGVVMGLATGTALAISGGLALGVLGAAILIDNAVNGSSTSANSAITIQLNPNIPLITPSGWTAPTGSAKQPTAPSSQGATITHIILGQAFFTPQAACNYWYANGTPGNPSYGTIVAGSVDTNARRCYFTQTGLPATQQYAEYVTNTTCPAGYTVSGVSCNLSNSSLVIKPVMGKQQIVRTGNTFATDPQINPTDKLPSTVVSVTSNSVTVNDSNGNTTTVTLNSDGTSTVVTTTANPDGTSSKSTVKLSAPNATTGNVEVTGTSSEQVSGKGTATGSTPLATSGSNIDISSLNKESTQQQIKLNTDEIKTNTKDIKDLLSNESDTPVDLAEQKTDYDEKADAHETKYREIGEGALDEHGVNKDFAKPMVDSANCSSYAMPINGSASTIDFCDKTNSAKDILGWIFYALTAWGIFGIFTTKRE